LGHLTRKNTLPNMTYNVFGGTLNVAQSNPIQSNIMVQKLKLIHDMFVSATSQVVQKRYVAAV